MPNEAKLQVIHWRNWHSKGIVVSSSKLRCVNSTSKQLLSLHATYV